MGSPGGPNLGPVGEPKTGRKERKDEIKSESKNKCTEGKAIVFQVPLVGPDIGPGGEHKGRRKAMTKDRQK